jgi:AraC-like DNA-binding protein/CheY-like chemotaxis protein
MLLKWLNIFCLSLAALVAGIETHASVSSTQSADQEPLGNSASLEHVVSKDKEMQLLFFAGLSVIFVGMVALLFRKYRGKGKMIYSKRNLIHDGADTSTNHSFTPTFFTSDSTPAILVAHHNNDVRLYLTNTLRLNYRVITTDDGLEAFEKCVDVVPDLVITDRLMPGMDGSKLCQKLRMTEATSHIPTIIMSSEEEGVHKAEWHQFADDHLFSTFDARELLMRVHKLLNQRKLHQEEYRRQLLLYPDAQSMKLPQHAFLKRSMDVLESEYTDSNFGVDQLAARVDLSRLQLYRKIKALTTLTPGDFIRQFRLEKAKRLLSQDGNNVAEVAARTGFANLSSFSKAFRDYTGRSPVQFTLNNSNEALEGIDRASQRHK